MSDFKQKRDPEIERRGFQNDYRLIFDSVNDGIIIHDSRGKIFDVNKQMYERLGYTKAEMIEMNLQDIVSEVYAKKIEIRTKKLQEEGVAVFESGDVRKDGTVIPVEISAREIEYNGRRAILSVVRDISQRKLAEELISKTLSEKEILLKEIQDQSKRIMQSFSLMLEYHCSKPLSPNEGSPIPQIMKRLNNYLQIYEKLYRYEKYTRIDFADFVDWQTKLLFSQSNPTLIPVQFEKDIANVYLNIHHAIPSALIIQELVSNSLSHAFPDGRSGKIWVQMQTWNQRKHILIVKDNGKGMPPSFDLDTANTLGFQLVKEFSKQIEGAVEIENSDGTVFKISFPNP